MLELGRGLVAVSCWEGWDWEGGGREFPNDQLIVRESMRGDEFMFEGW